jgi:hypothetical protein
MFRDLGVSERIKLDNLRRSWASVFKGPLAGHTAPVDLKEGILTVAVDSPAWLQHLRFLKNEMASKLTSFGVSDVRLRHGSVRRGMEAAAGQGKWDGPVFRRLTEQETESIEDAVSDIEDGELRGIVRSVLTKSAGRKRR